MIVAGILLPESVLDSSWFGVFASFVAINTVIYVTLSVAKLLPVVRIRRRRGADLRAESRSIYPATSSTTDESESGDAS